MLANYLRFFYWNVLRYSARHRLLALLNIGSVALGVAVYLAIRVANQSASHSFAASVDLVAGKAHLQASGVGGGLSDEVLPSLARAPGISAATPLLRGLVTLPDWPGEYLQVLGLDVFTNAPFRTFELTDFSAGEFDLLRWLAEPETIAVAEEFAHAHGLKAGDFLRAQVNGVERRLRVGFILRARGSFAVEEHFAAMDIGWAQELFARRGELDSVQLQVEPQRNRAAVAEELRRILPPDATVATPAQRSAEVENMLAGFRLNLTAMSLVSLLVGMFLIYNTVSASVVRRRSELGVSRSLGASRGEVRALFLAEAGMLGALGSLLGLAAGIFLARVLVGTVTRTISSFYVLLSVKELTLTPTIIVSAFLLGIFSVLLAAWLPADAAARMHPVRALKAGSLLENAVELSPWWSWAGILSLLGALIFSALALTSGPAWLGFGAAFGVLLGFSFLVPSVCWRFSASLRRVLGFGRQSILNLAAGNLARSLVRNSITIAALAAAVAMAIGTSVMVFSFRQTVASWIEQTLRADLFIAPAANEIAGPSAYLPAETIEFLEAQPSVAAVDTFREIGLPMNGKQIAVAVIRGNARREFPFLRGNAAEMMRQFREEGCVLVSESFARRHGTRAGEALEILTPRGPHRFPVAGIFYDYTRDQGVVYMTEKTFQPIWRDDRVQSLAVYLRLDASAAEVGEAFRARFSRAGEFLILSNRDLRTRVFEIFDQTFAVTYVLRSIAVLVAIVGICLTLTTLIAERTRELGIFRALGGSAAQLRALLLWESGMLGLLAAAIGLVSGICLSLVLTGVINRAFFGWTIRLAFPWSSLALTPLWVVTAAVLAGIFPAWRASRFVIAETLREE